jgi:hypothetical protein
MGILEAIKADGYRIGPLQAIVYDRRKTDIFPPGFLSRLYFQFRGNRYSKGDGDGILSVFFCGMNDLSHDAIVDFWLHHATSILGVWKDGVFEPAGCLFPTFVIGAGEDERAAYAGYAFIRPYWGSQEEEVLAMIGITQLFVEMNLTALHGQRFIENDATAKFMARFGFRDLCTLPNQLNRGGKLVPMTISTLERSTFESIVERMVLEAYRGKKSE